ncbi:MAG: hypothetical protein QM692_16595 [Thermomicrobiales bacterium]
MKRLQHLSAQKLLILLAALMAGGTVVSMWVAGARDDGLWQGFWSGIATTFVGVFLTVFLVDQLLRRVETQRRSGLTLHVRQRVSRIAFHETAVVLALLEHGPDAVAHEHAVRDADGINRIPEGFAERVAAASETMQPWLAARDARDWSTIGRTFERMAREYARVVSLFSGEMSLDMLQAMLRVEESAHRLAGIIVEHASRPMAAALDPDGAAAPDPEMLRIVQFHMARIMAGNLEILRDL